MPLSRISLIASNLLDAAADLDDDESASPAELALIAYTIAYRLYPDDLDDIAHAIHNHLQPMQSDHNESDCDICCHFADHMR